MSPNLSRRLGILAIMLTLACGVTERREAARPAGPMTFDDPRTAADALVRACRSGDVASMDAIFGESNRNLVLTGDQAADADRCRRFVTSADTMMRLDPWGDQRLVLVVGTDDFAFPVPIVRHGDRWQFDPEAGAAEVLRRRAGENELRAIGTCRSFVDGHAPATDIDPSRPWRGYYFRILSTPSGADGMVAWPAEYRVTGVESFLVGPEGVVLEKDLGPAGGASIVAYAPDASWTPVGTQ